MSRRFVVVLALGGCSFAFVTSAPKPARPAADCTESRILPIVDATLATGMVVGGIAALSAHTPCNSDPNGIDCVGPGVSNGIAKLAGTFLVGASVVYAFSAVRGFMVTGECRRLHARPAGQPPAVPATPAATEPDPNDDPSTASVYWCAADGRCVAEQSRCGGPCKTLAPVWCAMYTNDHGSRGFVCGDSRDSCLVLVADPAHSRGGNDFGECVVRMPERTGKVHS